jgi:hypothetical protein
MKFFLGKMHNKQHFYSSRNYFANQPKCIFLHLLYITIAGVFIYRLIWRRIKLDCQRIFNGDKYYAMANKIFMLTDLWESENANEV